MWLSGRRQTYGAAALRLLMILRHTLAATRLRSQGPKLWWAEALMLLSALRGALTAAWSQALVAVVVLSLSALGFACARARRSLAVACIVACTAVLLVLGD